MDGSLLACGFGPCVTIWRPDDLSLKCSLTHVGPQSDVKKVLFGCGDMGHLVINNEYVNYTKLHHENSEICYKICYNFLDK